MFDRFDVCEAWYLYATHYHGGQGSEEYRIFSRLARIRFRPSPMISVERLSENAREIFDGLVSRAGFAPYDATQEAGEDTRYGRGE